VGMNEFTAPRESVLHNTPSSSRLLAVHHDFINNMSSTTTTPTNFRSILDAALDSYAEQTGIDLVDQASADRFGRCDTSEDVLQLLQERETAFKDFRNTNRKLINCLRPVVQVIHSLSGIFTEIAGLVSLRH